MASDQSYGINPVDVASSLSWPLISPVELPVYPGINPVDGVSGLSGSIRSVDGVSGLSCGL
jgi:hypothetical protein